MFCFHALAQSQMNYLFQGITFPSRQMQAQLLHETYKEAGIDPLFVSYVECHGTGTKVKFS